ncbi:MAG: D-alanyl-D-alanine carboxypeptidase [Lachnospiraceae bacterium]|nr:D-alanyl-D-alanine carboxypeptidase [Lachnospiraceae bacterium]
MKCTNKRLKCKAAAILLVTAMISTGCGSTKYDMAYQLNSDVSSYQLLSTTTNSETLEPFAADLCVANKDVKAAGVDLSEVGAAALFDLKNLDTLYAKNVNVQVNPASLTKVMTALVAMKYGSADQMLTASENVLITEPGAQLCGVKPGDQMTLDQALHILLIFSANDVAVMIAEGISGSVEEFVSLMNSEAVELGATNCNFTNPNGLTEEGHYMTAYDLYLIFQEALQYDLFNQIIQMNSYSTVYTDRNGAEISLEVKNTNQYFKGTYSMPSNVTIIGGKTGTTNAAGHCLMLLSRSSDGTPYVSIIMKDTSGENLYTDMTNLLGIIK